MARNNAGVYLQRYFGSGWAFFIPYLAVYLLYALLAWRVNPAGLGEGLEQGATAGGLAPPAVPTSFFLPPALLHVYWVLHAVHLALGAVALRSWWQAHASPLAGTARFSPAASALWAILPWFGLALVFAVPGVYLEYPADTWEHYSRINEWSIQAAVNQHYAWTKSSYFLAYSLVGQIDSPLRQLTWLNAYATGCSLLLCWQYFRLAQATGLGRRAAFVFVVLNALTTGNGLFGFSRYYGISSSVFAQLGAVALITLGIRIAQANGFGGLSWPKPRAALLPALYPLSRFALTALALIAFTAFSHTQGLGIAALGIAAVSVWRIGQSRHARGILLTLALALAGASVVTILYWPRSALIDDSIRTQGWLTSWYGFNLFEISSPAFERMLMILGGGGLLNLLAGICLLYRNHVVAWLTITPLVALSLPVVAVPFLQQLLQANQPVLIFHRMLFAIPAGLAIVTLLARAGRSPSLQDDLGVAPPNSTGRPAPTHAPAPDSGHPAQRLHPPWFFYILTATLAGLILIPASSPGYGRLFNILLQPPADLNLRQELETIGEAKSHAVGLPANPRLVASKGISYAAYSTGARNVLIPYRSINESPGEKTTRVRLYLESAVHEAGPTLFIPQSPFRLYTAWSPTAYLSHHWHPVEVALEYANGTEHESFARRLGYQRLQVGRHHLYVHAPE
ncbi:hypothetical protein [Lacunisphaera limnophila]|uniref:hypothetical protein n=1 Tax=Lacunisphaera limnophila TaxID=1838286 RepID=UPI0008597B24|nr:hypothetical protein [Lacunisphaera limnophila]